MHFSQIYDPDKMSLLFVPLQTQSSVSDIGRLGIVLFSFLILLVIYLSILLAKEKRKNALFKSLSSDFESFSSRNLLQILMDNLQDFLYIKDTSGRFIVASRRLARLVGKDSSDELLGKTDHDFFPKYLADEFRKDELEIQKSGKAMKKKVEESKSEKGDILTVETSKFPIFDSENKVIGIVGIGRDITLLAEKERLLHEKNSELTENNIMLEERQEEIIQQQEELKVQTEKAAEERILLRTLINSMPDYIYVKDRQSRFLIGNKFMAKIMGANSPEEIISKTDFDYYDKELATEFYRDEQEIMRSKKAIINKEERGINVDGNSIIVSTTKVPLTDRDGNVIGIVGIGRDISQHKKHENELREKSDALQEANILLEERQEEIQQQSEELKAQSEHLLKVNADLEQLSFVASKTDNVIIIMNADGDFTWVNKAFETRYNMNLEKFISARGKNLEESSSNENIKNLLNEIKTKKKPINYISKTKIRKDIHIWSQTTISPILNEEGDISSLIAIDSDITSAKEAELQIQEQKNELSKLNSTKDKLFSIIAHDLKNPFHSIMGFSDLLLRSFDSIDDEKKKEFIALMNDSSSSAYGLLENLLNWARTQTNRIKFNPSSIDVAAIVREVYQIMAVNAQKKGIELVLSEDFKEVFAYADYNMVFTIFRNLVNNALKFTEKSGEISVSTRTRNNRLEISVTDTGIGMTDEEKEKLFHLDKFHTKAGTSGEAGTGLGLIVCREFALIHGSDIRIESEEGRGSTFFFSLPLRESQVKS